MQPRPKLVLTLVHGIFWLVFIGLCIKTGALLLSFGVSLLVTPEGARDLYLGLDLSDLYRFHRGHYALFVSLVIALSGLQAGIAYLIVQLFLRVDFARPFQEKVALLIARISHLALATGVLALLPTRYSAWLMTQGVSVPHEWGSAEFLFLAGVIFVLAQVFQRGVEFQTDSELTV